MALAGLTWAASLVLLGFGHVSLPDPIGVRYVAPAVATFTGQAGSNELALRLIAGLPVAILALTVIWLWRRESAPGRPALALAAASLLWFATIHAGWNLAYHAVDRVSELPRMEQTSVDVRALAHDVETVLQVLSINREDRDVAVAESLALPLRWYVPDDVREAPVRFESSPTGTPAIAILPADAKPPGNRYAGQRYRVSTRGDVWFENAAQLWRWLLYREDARGAIGTDAMVFVRAQ
jgi:hypothetical protein